MAHVVARQTLAMLRQPAMTKSLFFMLNSPPGQPWQAYVRADSAVRPGLGQFGDSYRLIEGARFRRGNRTVLILQNASDASRSFDPTQGGQSRPSQIELLVAANLASTERHPVLTTNADPARPLVLPPLRIARILWQQATFPGDSAC